MLGGDLGGLLSTGSAGPTIWILDLDGVVWRSGVAVPGAPAAVGELLARGHEVRFVTNSSAGTVAQRESELAAIGIDARGRVVTSAAPAARLVDRGARVSIIGGAGLVEALTEREVELVDDGPVDAVVVGFDDRFDYELLDRRSAQIRAGARFVATNLDVTFPTDRGVAPGCGALVAAVAAASGTDPEVAGKPEAPMVELLGELGSIGAVVGDRPDTDGLLADRLGVPFLLVMTGVTTEADLPVVPTPALVARDLAAAVAFGARSTS